MKLWLVELWKARVQYLRPYYACTKPQQTDYPINSRHVWSLPLMWTCWSTLILAILLLALTVEDIMDTGSALANLNLALYLNTPLMVFWWRFAVLMSEEDANSRYYKSKLRFCPCSMCSHSLLRNGCVMTRTFKSGVPVTMVIQPLKHKCCRRRRVKFIVHHHDSRRVISLLLMLAGDVETNPGPLEYDEFVASLPTKAREFLQKEIDWDHGGVEKDLDYIARQLTDWETKLVIPLSFTPQEVDLLKEKHQHSDPILLRLAFLREWKNRANFDATYENLLKACCDGGATSAAKAVCEVLRQRVEGYSVTAAHPLESPTPGTSSDQLQIFSAKESQSTGTQYSKLDSEAENSTDSDGPLLKRQTDKIRMEYSLLKNSFMKHFLERERSGDVSFDELYSCAIDVFDLEDHEYMFFKENRNCEQLLMKLFEQQNYVNFYKLKHLITQYGTQKDKASVQKYTEDYMHYAKQRVFDYDPYLFSPEYICNDRVMFASDVKSEDSSHTTPSPTTQLPDIIDPQLAVRVFQSQRGDLLVAIRFCLQFLANVLFSKSVINQEILEVVYNERNGSKERGVRLLNCVQETIAVESSAFVKFVDVLWSEPTLVILARQMVERYNNEEKPEKLLSEALKKGVVISKHVVIILVGIAGSGKSSFKRVLLELEPKDVRDSTGLAEDPLRSISLTRCIMGDSDSIKWEFVSAEELLSMLANAIREVGSSQESSNTAIKEVGLSQESSSTAIKEVGSSQEFSNTSDDCTVDDSSAQDTDDIIIDESDPLLPLISQSKGSRRLLDVHWVYVIDTGGQPQFLHLLPAFIKNISSCVCLVRLDQSLDEKPMIEFYESGKQCGKSYRSEYTNLQVVQSCVRTIHSRSCLSSENPPNCFVVGSHLDEYEKMEEPPESIEDKNKTLLTKFKSAKLEKSLIYYKISKQQDQGVVGESGEMCARHDELVYPLNCKDPKDEDKKIASKFRKSVMRHCPECETKIPLAWFVLEERIRQYATKNNVDYIDKATCIEKIAKPLNIGSIEFESALRHLLKLNIFRCYSSLPHLIFCGTQVVLIKLTEIVQYNYHLRKEGVGLSYEERSFIKEGIVSTKLLSQSQFSDFYSKEFTPKSFLDILLEVHAVAEIQQAEKQERKFLMPALLDELSEQELAKKRAQCSCPSLSPLLLVPENECLPNGLFTTLVAHLQNECRWKLVDLRPYQNCVSFCIPDNLIGDITLIASFKYLEVHVKCSIEDETDRVCDQAFRDVKSSLEASWKILYSGEVQYDRAFFCGSADCPDSLYKHHVLVICDQEYEKCSINTTLFSSLCESKRRWLKITNAAYIKEQRFTTIAGPIEPDTAINDDPQQSTTTSNALVSKEGIIWKGKNDQVLKVLKVYFYDRWPPWNYWDREVSSKLVIKLVNKHWRSNIKNIEHGDYIPQFVEVERPKEANIRVKFQHDSNTPVEASKSCVGAYAESIHDHSKPTMTLDLRNMTYHSMKATILHEFGHALGLGHEHQHPEFWKVMKKFFNISALQVCSQIESIPEFRQKYKGIDEGSFFKGTYDKMSVMHYPTSVLWLKKEFRHLTSPEDVDKESDEKISPDDKKFFKENFLNHLEYETSVPSEEDKKFVARIYYKESCKVQALSGQHEVDSSDNDSLDSLD